MEAEVVWEETFDVNNTKANVAEVVERYRKGQEPGKLMWASRPNKGADATLLDACPDDGNVEIDFYFLEPFGIRLRIVAIKHPSVVRRRENAPTVVAHAQGIAVSIKQSLEWALRKPDIGAPVREWSVYRFQMKRAGKRPPTHKEVADLTGYEHGSIRNDYSRFLAESGQVDEEENM